MRLEAENLAGERGGETIFAGLSLLSVKARRWW